MKKLALIAVLSGFFLAASAFAQEFTLKSPDVSGQLTENQVFSGFGCQGKNISPTLEWANSPPAMVGFNLNQHMIARASIISYYGR